MSRATNLHTQLLHQAQLLATKEPRRPKQASLRRSISTSYYAVYHFLIFKTTRKLVGTSYDLRALRELTSRAFAHGEMKSACKSFAAGGVSNLPTTVEEAMTPLSIPSELRDIAGHFVELQEKRHDADYNLRYTARKRDALSAHSKAKEVIKDLWPQISSHDATRFFTVALLTWKRISRR